MSSLGRNVLANYTGTAAVVVLQLIVVPVSVHFMGMEAWGIVAFFAALQTVLAMADVGMGVTISREFARLHPSGDGAQAMHRTLRTLEALYWGVGLVIAIACWLLAPWFVSNWLRLGSFPQDTAVSGIQLLGVAFALRWPVTLYLGGLAGLQHQVALNILRIGVEVMRHGGAMLVLWQTSGDLMAYALWHCVAGLLASLAAIFTLKRWMPASDTGTAPSWKILRANLRFSVGVGIVSALGILLSQLDKLTLSRLIPIEQYGEYALAATAAGALVLLAAPIHQAFFPRLVQGIGGTASDELANHYHRGCRLVATALAPAAASGIFFSDTWLSVWLQNDTIAREISTVFRILLVGAYFNGTMSMPWALQLAAGWTGLTLRLNAFGVIVAVPAIILGVSYMGAEGAAWVWCLLNVLYVMVGIQWMHLRLLPMEKWRWYGMDVALPGLISLLIAAAAWKTIGGLSGAIVTIPVAAALIAVANSRLTASSAKAEYGSRPAC